MSLKSKILLKIISFKKDTLQVEGMNGCGKTTLLRIILKKQQQDLDFYLWKLYFLKKTNTLISKINLLRINTIKLSIEQILIFSIVKKNILQKLEFFSSGQKKKIILAILFYGQSYGWYIDEPKTYIDSLFQTTLNQNIIKHLNQGGQLLLTTNIKTRSYILLNISLSRLELLTYRLSSDRSKPTEL